jgi:hypothetical protein
VLIENRIECFCLEYVPGELPLYGYRGTEMIYGALATIEVKYCGTAMMNER